MDRPRRSFGKRTGRLFRRALFALGSLALWIRDGLADDLIVLAKNMRLFLGTALVLIGVLSIASDRYCDGNTSSYYACTRPSTFYYYPWWAILTITLGSFLIVLWFLRRRQK
jgi:hypothetical protein